MEDVNDWSKVVRSCDSDSLVFCDFPLPPNEDGTKRDPGPNYNTTAEREDSTDFKMFLNSLINEISSLEKRKKELTEPALSSTKDFTKAAEVVVSHMITIKMRLEDTIKELEDIVDGTHGNKFERPDFDLIPVRATANPKRHDVPKESIDTLRSSFTIVSEPSPTERNQTAVHTTPIKPVHERQLPAVVPKQNVPILNREKKVKADVRTGTYRFNLSAKCRIKIVVAMGKMWPLHVRVSSNDVMIAERYLADPEEIEFGFNPKPDGSSTFRVYAACLFNKSVELTTELYRGTDVGSYSFWFRGDGLYGENDKPIKMWSSLC